MANILDGKFALITGVSGGGQVGAAVTEALAAEGAGLGIVARTQANVDARARELRSRGARVLAVAADLTRSKTSPRRSIG